MKIETIKKIQPQLSLKHTGFNIAILFSKEYPLIKIISRRGWEKDFKFLSIDTNSPYLDNREKLDQYLQEEREYKSIYLDKDLNEIGSWSEISKITI